MTLEQLLDRVRTRNLFLSATAIIVALFLAVRYFILPRFDPSLTQGLLVLFAKFLEDISTTIIVTVAVALFLWWVTPPRVRNSGVVVVEPRELKHHFSRALANTNEWRFIGGCGRYFRSAVLEEITRRARQESASKSVTAIILNPENDTLCERHARYRAGTRRGTTDGNWSAVRVKQELLTTIIATKIVADKQGLVDTAIYLTDHFSIFRLDISQLCAIETREDPSAPALLCEAGSYYFSALYDDFRIAKDQAKLLSGGESQCAAVKDLTSIKTAIDALRLTSLNLTDEELEGVVQLLGKISNPYA